MPGNNGTKPPVEKQAEPKDGAAAVSPKPNNGKLTPKDIGIATLSAFTNRASLPPEATFPPSIVPDADQPADEAETKTHPPILHGVMKSRDFDPRNQISELLWSICDLTRMAKDVFREPNTPGAGAVISKERAEELEEQFMFAKQMFVMLHHALEECLENIDSI